MAQIHINILHSMHPVALRNTQQTIARVKPHAAHVHRIWRSPESFVAAYAALQRKYPKAERLRYQTWATLSQHVLAAVARACTVAEAIEDALAVPPPPPPAVALEDLRAEWAAGAGVGQLRRLLAWVFM